MRLGIIPLALIATGCASSPPEEKTAAPRPPLTQQEQIAEVQKKDMPASQKEQIITQIKTGQGRR